MNFLDFSKLQAIFLLVIRKRVTNKQKGQGLMTAAEYRDKILPEVYRRYSHRDGLLGLGITPDKVKAVRYCLCTADNPPDPWLPKKGYMWHFDDLLFEGDITEAGKIARLFNKYKVCQLKYTTALRIEKNSNGYTEYLCSDEQASKCKKKCPRKALLKGNESESSNSGSTNNGSVQPCEGSVNCEE